MKRVIVVSLLIAVGMTAAYYHGRIKNVRPDAIPTQGMTELNQRIFSIGGQRWIDADDALFLIGISTDPSESVIYRKCALANIAEILKYAEVKPEQDTAAVRDMLKECVLSSTTDPLETIRITAVAAAGDIAAAEAVQDAPVWEGE